MSASTLHLSAAPLQAGTRRLTTALMGMGVGQFLIWLGTAIHNFYAGQRLLVLAVHAGPRFGASHAHLAAMLPSPAGYFSTGTQGELLYRPTALSDYFLFYHLGSFTGLDALFLAGVSIYLWWALGRRPPESAFTPAAGRALAVVGAASLLMYLLSMAVDILAREVFQAKTQYLFTLGSQPGTNVLYVVLALVLGVCGQFFQQGRRLQQESELTI